MDNSQPWNVIYRNEHENNVFSELSMKDDPRLSLFCVSVYAKHPTVEIINNGQSIRVFTRRSNLHFKPEFTLRALKVSIKKIASNTLHRQWFYLLNIDANWSTKSGLKRYISQTIHHLSATHSFLMNIPILILILIWLLVWTVLNSGFQMLPPWSFTVR